MVDWFIRLIRHLSDGRNTLEGQAEGSYERAGSQWPEKIWVNNYPYKISEQRAVWKGPNRDQTGQVLYKRSTKGGDAAEQIWRTLGEANDCRK